MSVYFYAHHPSPPIHRQLARQFCGLQRKAADVERDLAAGVVGRSTLDKIEKLNKDLADTCLEHIQMNPLVREFWKQMVHIKIGRDKADEQERLAALLVPVIEG